MSLIAVCYNDNEMEGNIFPIVVADILMSTNYGRPNVSLPTFLKGAKSKLPKHRTYLPIGLVQKLYIIKDNLVIALAGNVQENIDILAETRNYFKYKDVSDENIRELVTQYLTPLKLKDSVFCFVKIEMKSKAHSEDKFDVFEMWVGKGRWTTAITHNFGRIKAAGSGADDFIRLGERVDPDSRYSTVPSEFKALENLYKHISLLGKLISIEHLTLETLINAWGANYELVILNSGKFEKVKTITQLIIKVKFDLETSTRSLELTFAYCNKYEDDILVVTAVDFSEKQTASYYIKPLDRLNEDIPDNDKDAHFKFQTTEMCITFNCYFSNGKQYHMSSYYYSNPIDENEKPSVELRFDGNGDYYFYLSEDLASTTFRNIVRLIENIK